MKNIFKRTILLSLSAVIAMSQTGCAGLTTKVEAKKFEKPVALSAAEKEISQIQKMTDSYKAIEIIEVESFVMKDDNLNHTLPFSKNISVDTTESMTLKEFSRYLGIPVKIEASLADRKLDFEGKIDTDIKTALDTVASLTNTFWTYEGNIIKFQRTKTITYSFPFFSMERVQSIYNTGSSDSFDVKVQNDIFGEIQSALSSVLDDVTFGGQIQSQTKESSSLKDSNANLDSTKKNQDSSKEDSVSDTTSELDSKTKDNLSSNTKGNQADKTNTNTSGSVLETNKAAAPAAVKPFEIKPISAEKVDTRNINLYENKVGFENKKTKGSEKKKGKVKASSEKENKTSLISEDKSSLKDNTKDETKVSNFITTYQDEKSKISISKESGVIFAKVTPEEEAKITKIIEKIVKKSFNNMVLMDTYILEVNSEKVKDYNLEFSSLIQSGLLQSTIGLAGNGLSVVRDSLTLRERLLNSGTPYTPTSGQIMSSVLKYFISDSSGSIMSQPKIVTLPNIPARIKDTVSHPYIEPSTIPSGAGQSVSYQVKKVEEGIDLSVLPTVFADDSLLITLGLNINQYLGDKAITAGIAGSFNLPQSAPKKLNTTFRIKPGDVIVLGGVKGAKKTGTTGSSFGFDTTEAKNVTDKDFIVVAMPRLVKFVEKK